MSAEPQLFRIEPDTKESSSMEEVDFVRLGFRERRDIQEWIAKNPRILGEDLLIIGKEFSNFDRTSERLDLLAVDAHGRIVIIEVKRDDTGNDAHWQAIKYASYFRNTKQREVVRILASYESVSEEEAEEKLRTHLGGDLDVLNNDQRIILVSHRFALEVTSAALWLNEKSSNEDMISCVQLTPYRDDQNGDAAPLYIQASRIIPVPGAENYVIETGGGESGGRIDGFTVRRAHRSDDKISSFFREIDTLVTNGLSGNIRPDRRSRWARIRKGGRDYILWYSRPPWKLEECYFQAYLRQGSETKAVTVAFYCSSKKHEGIEAKVSALDIHAQQKIYKKRGFCGITVDLENSSLDEGFRDEIADTLKCFIEKITPVVDEFVNEINEEGRQEARRSPDVPETE